MTTAPRMRLPWQKLGLTALAAAAYVFFWINGPLQERPPVFEFEEHMAGFAEPVRLGEETQTTRFGVTAAREEHPYYRIMTAKQPPPTLFSVIGDARTNPGLGENVAAQVLSGAKAAATSPDSVTLKTALDMYYAEERDAAGNPVQLYLENTGLNKDIKGYAGPIDIGMTVGMDGKIRSVRHLRSLETTSYLRKIEKAGFYTAVREHAAGWQVLRSGLRQWRLPHQRGHRAFGQQTRQRRPGISARGVRGHPANRLRREGCVAQDLDAQRGPDRSALSSGPRQDRCASRNA